MTKNCAAGLCLWRLSFVFFMWGCAVGCIDIFAIFLLLYFFGFVSGGLSSP